MHYEIMFDEHVDCLQFHVSSSLRAAEKYISDCRVAPYSWWQIHSHVVDHDRVHWCDEGKAVHYYRHTGKPLTSAPIRRAISAYRRAQQKETQNQDADVVS